MVFRYFNLRYAERKWFWIVTYDFERKKTLTACFVVLGLRSNFH